MIELNTDLNFYKDDFKMLIPVVSGLISFIIFWFFQKSEKLKLFFIHKYGTDKGTLLFFNLSKYLGGLTLGIIPASTYFTFFTNTSPAQLGFSFDMNLFPAISLWTAGLSLIIIPLILLNAKIGIDRLNFPQISPDFWNPALLNANLAAWAIYLLGYEMLFRGVLLFPLVEHIGLWPAIAVNIGMYSATHIPKGLKEALGAIPFSVVLCLLCVYSGSFWIAFLVHVVMAWTNSIAAYRQTKKMDVILTK